MASTLSLSEIWGLTQRRARGARGRTDGRPHLDEVDELGAESRVSVELIPQGFCRALLNQMDRLGVWVWTERRNVDV